MNVLYIATYEGLSGASYSLLGMINELKKMGVNPLVVLLKKGALITKLEENNIDYIVLKGYPWVIANNRRYKLKYRLFWIIKCIYNSMANKRISRIIIENKIDLVHINAFTANVGLKAAKKMNIPCIWHMREFVEEDLGKQFWNKPRALKELSQADAAIAISNSVKEKFNNNSINNINVIYNGVPRESFLTDRDTPILSGSVTEILISGRIDPGKGHEELLDAIKIVVDAGYNIHLMVAGTSQNKQYEDYIKGKAIKNSIDQFIDFLGYRNDLPQLYKMVDISIVASKAEAFGRVTVEAMMAQTLVIGANTAGTKELIQNEYGMLYEQGDALSLAKQIMRAIDNKAESRKIALKAKTYAAENFTAQKNASSILNVYRETIECKKH